MICLQPVVVRCHNFSLSTSLPTHSEKKINKQRKKEKKIYQPVSLFVDYESE
jgi:hypothetical protein